MPGVVFVVDKDGKQIGEKTLEFLHIAATGCIAGEGWEGVENEVARLRNNGVRIGSMLETPVGWLKPEWSFAFDCWDVNSDDPPFSAGNDLRKVARRLLDKPTFKNIRVIGLD